MSDDTSADSASADDAAIEDPEVAADAAPGRAGGLLLDAMLGKLATYLRMCGYDAAYSLDRDVEADDDLLALAAAEDRRIVTRDRQLAERAPEGVPVESRDATDQLRELRAAGFDLSLADPPTRCGRCNGQIDAVGEPDADRPEYVPDETDDLWRCEDCGQFFWKGSHWDDVRERLRAL